MLSTGCASFGFGNSERADESSGSEVQAAQYLAQRGVAAARQIAMATASQSVYEGGVRANSADGSQPERRIVRRRSGETGSSTGSDKSTEGDESTGTDRGGSASSEKSGKRRRLRRRDRDSKASRRASGGDESTVVDHGISSAVVSMSDASAREEIAETYAIDAPPESAIAIEGTFRQHEDLPSDQVAVVEPGHRIRVYAEGRSIASLTLGAGTSPLPDGFAEVSALRVVRDGTLQIMGYWAESKPESDKRTIHVGIFKVIGDHVGTIFERVVAEQKSSDSDPMRRGYVDVLRGDRHRYLKWTPAGEDGARVDEKAVVLHWNKWEGVFRRPVPPPTAPSPKS